LSIAASGLNPSAWLSLCVMALEGIPMRAIAAGLRPAFGLFVIAHGLAHAVLPLRGGIDPATLSLNFYPMIFYGTAVIGFTIAGLGVFGIRPFASVVKPAMMLASAYSLVAIATMGAGGLRWGAGTDIALFLVSLSGLHRYLPARPPHRPGYWHAAGVAIATAFVIYAATSVVLWPLHRSWGSQPSEHALSLPGDPAGRIAGLEIQHAVTVNAPPEAVWPWLVQLGQDRAGFYSYDWLERAFGVDIHNAAEIRPEWQARQAGDRVRATQDGYLGGALGRDLGWTVQSVEPGRAMVLQYWGAFVLEPTADGKTRFIIRTKVGNEHAPAWAAALDMISFEMPHFIMERRMMLRIKALAEANART
jgi:uncharacterized protein YndB with AHSA1/START domain